MDEEDELDPRIQVELEKLNTATDEINKLEIELDEANTTFRMLLNECTRRLKVHSSKYGGAIVSARPYYEALDVARMAQQECQRAAVSFQRANEVHEAAKETVALAETRFMSQQPEWRFDSAWQEALNHATLKVSDAEKQRAESAAYHGHATAHYKQAQDKVHQLEQRLHRTVTKSRPYFEEKARCNDQLAAQKAVVEALQKHVARVKAGYADSLRRLEAISEEIHSKRAIMMEACRGVREPGVGAELAYEGELTDLRVTLDAHRASRAPNGDAKSTLVPGATRHQGPVSLEVSDHFTNIETSLEEAPGASRHDSETGSSRHDNETGSSRHDNETGSSRHDNETGSSRHDNEPGSSRHDNETGLSRHDSEAVAIDVSANENQKSNTKVPEPREAAAEQGEKRGGKTVGGEAKSGDLKVKEKEEPKKMSCDSSMILEGEQKEGEELKVKEEEKKSCDLSTIPEGEQKESEELKVKEKEEQKESGDLGTILKGEEPKSECLNVDIPNVEGKHDGILDEGAALCSSVMKHGAVDVSESCVVESNTIDPDINVNGMPEKQGECDSPSNMEAGSGDSKSTAVDEKT